MPVLNVNAERLFLDLGGYDCFPSFRLGSFNVQWPSAITSAFDVVAGCINENNKLSCLAFEVAKQIPFLDRFTSDCTDRNQIFSCVASNIKSSLPIIGDCESFGCIASEITQEIPFVGAWVEACSEESNVILCMGNRFLQDVPIFQAVQEFFVEIKDCVLERSAVDLVSAGGIVAFGCLFQRMAQDIPVLSTTAEMLGRVTDCISSNTSPVTIFAGGAISWGCFIYEVVQAVPFMKNVFDMLNPCNEGENVWDCVVRFVGEIPPFNYLKKVLEAGKDFIPFVITKTVELFLNVVQFLDPLENSLSLVPRRITAKSRLSFTTMMAKQGPLDWQRIRAPKAKRLQHLVALCKQDRVLPPKGGQEPLDGSFAQEDRERPAAGKGQDEESRELLEAESRTSRRLR